MKKTLGESVKKIMLLILILILPVNSIAQNTGIKKSGSVSGITGRDSLFSSFGSFRSRLDSLSGIEDNNIRDSLINVFWDTLTAHKQIPYVTGDSVAFLYKGTDNSSTVYWPGDFNGWSVSASDYNGSKAGKSNIWVLEKSYPVNARLDYKILVNGSWIMDPVNPYVQAGGFGPNSELRMPEWVYPEETVYRPWINGGQLSGNILIFSTKLNYNVNYTVYTPAGYDSLSNLPVIYVTDGHEYSNNEMGSMKIVLDNLINDKKIIPVMAVFIDPRDPGQPSNNKRGDEYTMNNDFADFVSDELKEVIDNSYKTNTAPEATAILGTSLGGLNSAYFGAYRHDKFRLIAIQSPALSYYDNLIQIYENSALLPLKIFMSTGTIYDTQNSALKLKEVLDTKGYPLIYTEVPEGHSWGNWRSLLDDLLIYFFKEEIETGISENTVLPENYTLAGNYPNPFNIYTTMWFRLQKESRVTLKIYNLLGQKVKTVIQNKKYSKGYKEINVFFGTLSSGIYFYKLDTGTTITTGKIALLK